MNKICFGYSYRKNIDRKNIDRKNIDRNIVLYYTYHHNHHHNHKNNDNDNNSYYSECTKQYISYNIISD